jgi:hypothetical protein
VDRIPLDRLGLIAGLLAWLAVGVPVAVAQLTGNSSPVDDVAWWWWSAYLAYGVLCVLGDNAAVQSRPRLLRLLLAVQVLLGLAVVSLGPEWGFTSVLLVISAVYAAYIMPFRGAMLLVAAQTLAVALLLLDGADPTYVWTTAFVYAGFQGFAVLMVETGLREAVARQRLAEVNAELQAAQALLADSTRSVERLRIARDLHDLVGHQLTALTLNLEAAAHHSQGAAAEHVQRSRAAAKALAGGRARRGEPAARADRGPRHAAACAHRVSAAAGGSPADDARPGRPRAGAGARPGALCPGGGDERCPACRS